MKTVADDLDLSVQRWPISSLLEDYFIAARRFVARPNAHHAAELDVCCERVCGELAKHGPPRARDLRAATDIAADRAADDRRYRRCQCWRCGVARRQRARRC